MKKLILLLLMLTTMIFMGACGLSEQSVTEDTITVDKKGQVSGIIVEDFEKEYYSQQELSQMITEEIDAYNTGGDAIRLEKFEVSDLDGKAYVNITYASTQDYKVFNEAELFDGTVSDAYQAGYEFVDVRSVNEGDAGLDAKSVPEKGSMRILIFEEPVAVQVSGKIAYVSDGVTVTNKRAARADGDGLFYVLYE